MYARVYEKLQAASPEAVMWFQPAQVPDGFGVGFPIISNTGFKTPPGGKVGSSTHVMNEHTYCCELGPDVCAANGEPVEGMAPQCAKWHDKKLRIRTDNAKALGIPLVLSEFGACMGSAACITEINQVADVSDRYLTAGWAYWQFKTYEDLTTTAGTQSEGFYNKDGALQTDKVKALARTYVQHAQGTLKQMQFATADSDSLK